MKYILGISLNFQHFKGDTKIKIFSDDFLIDDMILNKSIATQPSFSYYPDLTDTINFTTKKSRMPVDLPERIFLFEIDEAIIGDKIWIEIDDQNSNYTNGFMTRSNMINLHQVFLLPKSLLKKDNFNKLGKLFRKRFKKYDDLSDQLFKKGIFDCDAEFNASAIDWPFCYRFYKSENHEEVEEAWLGGTNKIYVHVRKKFGVKHLWPGSRNSKKATVMGLPVWFATYCEKYGLINKFNEDQRSNIT